MYRRVAMAYSDGPGRMWDAQKQVPCSSRHLGPPPPRVGGVRRYSIGICPVSDSNDVVMRIGR